MRSLYRLKRLAEGFRVDRFRVAAYPCRPFRAALYAGHCGALDHATYVSTKQGAPGAHAWLSRAHGHPWRPQGAGPPPFQGPQEARSVTFDVSPARSGADMTPQDQILEFWPATNWATHFPRATALAAEARVRSGTRARPAHGERVLRRDCAPEQRRPSASGHGRGVEAGRRLGGAQSYSPCHSRILPLETA